LVFNVFKENTSIIFLGSLAVTFYRMVNTQECSIDLVFNVFKENVSIFLGSKRFAEKHGESVVELSQFVCQEMLPR
jgi:hypothetical protein